MTVVVSFLCTDGVVIAADSMLTPSMGGISVGHHKGRKVEILTGPQLFAFAGDQGQGARFRIMADGGHASAAQGNHAIDYPLALTQSLVQQFNATGIGSAIDLNTALAFGRGGQHHCCVFEGAVQPRLLDATHYYAVLGSGKMAGDPFLRFLVDIFCKGGQPNTREAIFLATWVIQHCIDTAPGGIAGPIRVCTLEPDGQGGFRARDLPDDEIAEHQQAVESAGEALCQWRDEIQSGAAAEAMPELPAAT